MDRQYRQANAFTLAELLVALLILGVISTFTIPKVLSSQANQQRKAILKETIAAINEIVYTGYLEGSVKAGVNGSYILSHINAVKLCDTNSNTQGCFSHSATEGDFERGEPGFIMHSGATVAGVNDDADPNNGIVIDANGAAGPNIAGQDQIFLEFCYGSGCSNSQRAGTLHPSPFFGTSEAFYYELFGQ